MRKSFKRFNILLACLIPQPTGTRRPHQWLLMGVHACRLPALRRLKPLKHLKRLKPLKQPRRQKLPQGHRVSFRVSLAFHLDFHLGFLWGVNLGFHLELHLGFL